MIDGQLINILTRTSNRPNSFKKCIDSVNKQKFVNINHIISVDDDKSEEYVKKYTSNYIRVKKYNKPIPYIDPIMHQRRPAPYNLYLNDLKNTVKEGWIMILDDDDMFLDSLSLYKITRRIESEDQMLYWKVKFSDSRVVPNQYDFDLRTPILNDFSMIGFMHHSKYNNAAEFDYYSGGDCIYAKQLQNIIPQHTWIDIVCTGLQNNSGRGGRGQKNDF